MRWMKRPRIETDRREESPGYEGLLQASRKERGERQKKNQDKIKVPKTKGGERLKRRR